MTDYSPLIERLEKASGPDRELDCRVWLLVGDALGEPFSLRGHAPIKPSEVVNGRWMGSAVEKYPNDMQGIARSWRVPCFTASLDAAMSLVPEGECWRVEDHPLSGPGAIVGDEADTISCCATPALALCAAALKARATLTKDEPK